MVTRKYSWVPPSDSVANNSEQAITVAEAISAYTLGGAYALLAEDSIRTIEIGKYADLIVLNQNLRVGYLGTLLEGAVQKKRFNVHALLL